MKDKVKEMIKNVIEENAIQFKTSTSDALYNKIGNRLKDEYKTVAKKMFNSLQEAAPSGTSISQGIGSGTEEVSAAVAPPGGGPSSRERENPSEKPGYTTPNPDLERPGTTVEEWLQQRPNINDFDNDGDGKLSNDERAAYEHELRKWYNVYVDIWLLWYHWQRRNNAVPYQTPKPPSWRSVQTGQPFDPKEARERRERRRRGYW